MNVENMKNVIPMEFQKVLKDCGLDIINVEERGDQLFITGENISGIVVSVQISYEHI